MPKRILTASITLLAVFAVGAALAVTPAVAHARGVTARHVGVYNHLRRRVERKFGARAPGRNIIAAGRSDHMPVTDRMVVDSIHVMERMLAPAPLGQSVAGHGLVMTGYVPPSLDGLAQCVEEHESGGDENAVNGQYEGVGQWSPSAWAEDGGTRYASTPLGATKEEQEAVLAHEGDATLAQQQGQYDGCS